MDKIIYGQPEPKIGIITALPEEFASVKVMLENRRDYPVSGRGAGRQYLLGEIPTANGGKHSIVLALADMGNNIAAARATLLLEHFPSVNSIIMVGIAGGVPHPKKVEDHIRLGDVVISDRQSVVQYDFVKEEIKEVIDRHPPRPPSASLLEAVRHLKVEELIGHRPWLKSIDKTMEILKWPRPSQETDLLVSSTKTKKIIPHPEDTERVEGQPRIFIGPIASSNTLLKDPKKRDILRDKFGVKAVEMEASGIADATWNHEVGYLVVRGICDYCDSNKGDAWHKYAAVVAAGYTRALLESMNSQISDSGLFSKNLTPTKNNQPQLLRASDFSRPLVSPSEAGFDFAHARSLLRKLLLEMSSMVECAIPLLSLLDSLEAKYRQGIILPRELEALIVIYDSLGSADIW